MISIYKFLTFQGLILLLLFNSCSKNQNIVPNVFVDQYINLSLAAYSDLNIIVDTPKGEYAPVEDVHLIINHVIVTWMHYHIDSL